MAKKKHFITKKMINAIIQKYGGGHRWSLRQELSGHGTVTYTDSKGHMLTINLMWEGENGQFPYIEVHITTTEGVIYRRDRYDFKDTEYKVIEFVYTEENGHFYNDFRKVGVTMARETKESKIKKLEERIASLEQLLEQASKRNTEMQQRGEDSFLNSPTYCQMQQQIDFFKSIADLNQKHIDSQRKCGYRQADKVQQVYEDNKRLMEQAGEEYSIGCVVREDAEYEKLREEIRELKGKLDGKVLNLVARDKMIFDMMVEIADLRAENNTLRKVYEEVEKEREEAIDALIRANDTEDADIKVKELAESLRIFREKSDGWFKAKSNIIVMKNKLDGVRRELKKEKMRKYDSYSESDETSYEALLRVNETFEHLLTESNATYDRLAEEIKKLKEKVESLEEENKNITETHVEALKLVGELNAQDDTVKGLYEQIESLQNQLRLSEGQCKVYEANVKKLSERREELAKLLGDARQKISELESQRDGIFSRNSDPDIVTMYHQLEDRMANTLNTLKKSRQEVKKWKSMYYEAKGQIPTPTTPPTEDKGRPQSVGRPKTDDEKMQKVLQMREDGKPMRTIAKELGISLGTVSNIVKRSSK